MFSQIHGLPLHPLAVHAAVVFVPLAALLGVLFVVPRTRAWSRIPMLVVSLGAVASVFVARQSGLSFQTALGYGGTVGALIDEHRKRANLLLIFVAIFAVIAIAAFLFSRTPDRFSGTLATVVSVALVVGAALVAFQTYRVGDIGSKAVWNPDGTQNYGSLGTSP